MRKFVLKPPFTWKAIVYKKRAVVHDCVWAIVYVKELFSQLPFFPNSRSIFYSKIIFANRSVSLAHGRVLYTGEQGLHCILSLFAYGPPGVDGKQIYGKQSLLPLALDCSF